jgi:hypothetical protein
MKLDCAHENKHGIACLELSFGTEGMKSFANHLNA